MTTTNEIELSPAAQAVANDAARSVQTEMVRAIGTEMRKLGETLMTPMKMWVFDVAEQDIQLMPRPVMLTMASSKEQAARNFRGEWEHWLDSWNFTESDLGVDFEICIQQVNALVYATEVES